MGESALEGYLSKCITLYFEPTFPGQTLRDVFSVVADHNRYPKDLASPVHRNPAMTQLVLRTDFLQTRIQEWIAESPEGQYNPRIILERMFTLLGRQASRNLVACIQVQKIMGILPRKKNDRMAIQPGEQLKHSVYAEEFCQQRSFAYSEWAYIGGYHYDLLLAALIKQKGPRDAINAFTAVFPENLKAAHIAYEIATHLGDFKFNGLVFPATLCLGIGKILMSALHPKELLSKSYTAFFAEFDKLKVAKWEHLEYRERARFGVDAAELAGLYVNWIGLLAEISPAVTYANDPFYLRTIDPDQFKIASILHLSQAMAIGRPFTLAHKHSMAALGFTDKMLGQVKKKVTSK